MFNNLIIGAGQLGSRHLQGLLKFDKEQIIYVLDTSKSSLNIAEERASEIEFEHTIKYITNWDNIPSELDLVIVATGASVRSKVVTKLLKVCNVKNLILEKILFQDLESYSDISKLIKATGTPTWVNHPRRMFKHYIDIKNKLSASEEVVNFQVFGGNWDLACNALHFIDLISFLSNSEVMELDFKGIDNKVINSKRSNCIEFTGSFSGKLKNGNNFNICSGKKIPVKKLLKNIGMRLGVKPKTRNIAKQKGDMLETHGDNKKIKLFLKRKIRFTSLDEGLEETIYPNYD